MINFAKKIQQRLSSAKNNEDGAYLRAQATLAVAQVIDQNLSLRTVLKDPAKKFNKTQDQALFKELCFGSIRWFHRLETIVNLLLHKPLPDKHSDIKYLLCIGIYQLSELRIPQYACVNATVAATKLLNKPWATRLVNKLLRQYIRKEKQINQQASSNSIGQYSHPNWMISLIQQDWPEQWQDILAANNIRPPQTLRINPEKTSASSYVALLAHNNIAAKTSAHFTDAVIVKKPVLTADLPGFDKGLCSIQDLAGQSVATLLDLAPNQVVLDACAAPGSKTCHILETEPRLQKLVAIDIDAERLIRIKENITRLELPHDSLKMVLEDATHTKQWWDGALFDRILLDAPCSALGVIRRHPDIKLLRLPSDIDHQSQLQYLLLKSLWPLLKPSGKLLYTTCSILHNENDKVIHKFMNEHNHCKVNKLDLPGSINLKYGYQRLPSKERETDGFYYCLLTKTQ